MTMDTLAATANGYPESILAELEAVHVLGVRVHPLSLETLNTLIADMVASRQKAIVANVNVHALNLAYTDTQFRAFLNNAEIVFCDGAGVILGARLLGHHIPRRITYADWIWDLAGFVEPLGASFFFLGAAPGVAEEAADCLRWRFPEIRVIGTHHGYFDKTPGSVANESVIDQINQLSPDILVVGLGMPLQERWLMQNWHRLDVRIALTGGAVFDYASGHLRRAPRWMTDHGLEWLGRLLVEPRRLWKRYIVGNPLFFYRLVRQCLGRIKLDEPSQDARHST